MSDLLITRHARPADVPGLAVLINRSYRGQGSRRGWTNEAHLIDGSRIDEEFLRELLHAPYTRLWCCHQPGRGLVGCVCLMRPPGDTLHLSLLAVAPEAQAQGVGRHLLLLADEQARQLKCPLIHLTVLAERPDLLDWYTRHGYYSTGSAEPFPDTDRFGRPRQPLHLLTLERPVLVY